MSSKAKPILIIVGAILTLMFPLSRWIASVYLRNAPSTYFSVVTIENKLDIPDLAHSADSSGRIEPQIFTTRFLVVKKAEILIPVVEKLDLVKKFSPPGTTMPIQWVIEELARRIVVQEQRNTTLVEIGVYHADKQLAADIANAIAITYCDARNGELRKELDLTVAEMDDELKTRREEVARLSRDAATIRMEDGIVDPDPDGSNAILAFTTERDEHGSRRKLRIDEKTRVSRYVEKKSNYLMTRLLVDAMTTQLVVAIRQRNDAYRRDYGSQVRAKVWQRAEPAQTPARPDAVAILRLANTIGGSLGVIGVVLILLGLRIPSRLVSRA